LALSWPVSVVAPVTAKVSPAETAPVSVEAPPTVSVPEAAMLALDRSPAETAAEAPAMYAVTH
jgi:hypothetical protein